MYDKLVQILGISEDDTQAQDLIETLIDICSDEAKSFTYEKDTSKLQELIIAMVCERYNTLDYSGIESTSYSGVSQHFRNGYSDQVKSLIKAKRHLKLV